MGEMIIPFLVHRNFFSLNLMYGVTGQFAIAKYHYYYNIKQMITAVFYSPGGGCGL